MIEFKAFDHDVPKLIPRLCAAIGLLLCLVSPLGAQSRGLGDFKATGRGETGAASGMPVDVELVLAVDISWSMSDAEQIIQRNGYAAAFRSSEVQDAILKGVHGAIAVTYVEWAGSFTQNTIIPWTLLDSKASADAFAYRLATEPPTRARRTSISSGLLYSADRFDRNGFNGMKRVIDVSGDGPNNQGSFVNEARDAVVAKGITINGLPLMTRDDRSGFSTLASIDDLDRYYEDCVVGGPGAFVIPVRDWSQFPEAVRRKLVLELASDWPVDANDPRHAEAEPPVVPVDARSGVDCRIGEALWQERQRFWMDDAR